MSRRTTGCAPSRTCRPTADEIEQFFGVYTQLSAGPASTSEGQESRQAALRVLEDARAGRQAEQD